MRYAHTNIISLDWRKLADFYIEVFDCTLVPPVRNITGKWLSEGTGLQHAKLVGAHLRLPGHGPKGPTLEIFQYDKIETQDPITANLRGFGHIAFEVDDIKNSMKKVLDHGGSELGTIGSKSIEGAGTVHFVYMRDPEGNIVELQNWN